MLEALKPHDHLCLIYESPEEWRAAAVPFIAIGLKRGEKCLYITDTSATDEIRKYLGEEGIDLASVEKSGQLSVLHETEAYTKEGSFDPDRMIALLISETEKAVAEGYPALRVTGEMTWVLRGHPGSEKLLEYEAKLNDFFPKYPCLAICQYDRRKFNPEIIKGIIMTHPLLIRGSHVYHNCYYIPSEGFFSEKRAEIEVQHWLESLERKRQTMDMLNESVKRYRTLTEQSVMGLVVVQDFRIVFANAAFSEIVGYSIDELLSLPPEKVQALVHPEDQALVWGRFRDCLAGKAVPPHYEYRGIRKDGSVCWLEMHASRIEYDGRAAVQGAIIDITKHKQAEEALRQREKYFQALVENSSDVLTVIDSLGVVQYQSPNYKAVWGRDPAGEIGRDMFKDVHPDDVALVGEKFDYLLKNPGGMVNIEVRAQHTDGSWRTIEVVGRNLIDHPAVRGIVVNFRDITERKRAEEKISHLNLMLRAIRNVNQLIAKNTDRDGLLKGTCRTFVQDRGYNNAWIALLDESGKLITAAESGLGRSFQQIVKRLKRGELPYCGRKALEKSGAVIIVQDIPLRCIDCPVAEKHTDGTCMSIQLKHGKKVYGMMTVSVPRGLAVEKEEQELFEEVAEDIAFALTSRELEEALRRNEERYRTIFEETGDGYFETDLAGNFTLVNDALCRLLGYSREELVGMNYRNYTPEENVRAVFQAYNRMYRTGEPLRDFPYEAIRKDGSRAFADTSAFPIRNEKGEIIGFRGIRRDITERMARAQEYQTIISATIDGFLQLDMQGRFLDVNEAYCNLIGYTRDELLNMSITDVEAMERPEETAEHIRKTKEVGFDRFETRHRRKDGKIVDVAISVNYLPIDSGRMVVFVRDITEHKMAEEERRQLEQKAQIASRLASVGEMTAGIAHEINNPLTAITGYAQLLMDRKDVPSDIKRDLAAINEGAQRVSDIVKRLLAFSRQTKPERRYVDINELIQSTLALRDYHLRTNNIKVTTKLAADLPQTVADPGQIQQVLLNLIVNAETEMKLAHGKGKLTITTEKSDNTIKICVIDDGPGIKPEIIDRIFDPFFTTREMGQGTGLGLSLCYGIVAEHNGRIYAKSKFGKGATFVVEIPVVAEAELAKPVEPVVEEAEKAVKAKILVVDDEKMITDLVKRVLTGKGYKVDTANNAADALKMIENQRYHLILLDIKMPGVDGVELYRRIQKIARSLARRVVFITGDVMGASTEEFLCETKVARLDKPFSSKQLKRVVKSALSTRW